MRNQKGLTLIEVLGSITLLAVAVLGLIYLLQQTTLFSKHNEKLDRNVIVARTVMEEIKANLSGTAPSMTIYGQSVDLTALRSSPAGQAITIYYPDPAARQLKIEIQSLPFQLNPVTIKSASYQISDYFRLIHVTSTDPSGKDHPYTLEGYAQYR